jgi:hypothetical protein
MTNDMLGELASLVAKTVLGRGKMTIKFGYQISAIGPWPINGLLGHQYMTSHNNDLS